MTTESQPKRRPDRNDDALAERPRAEALMRDAISSVLDPNGHFYDCIHGKRGHEPGDGCSIVCRKIRAAADALERIAR